MHFHSFIHSYAH